MKDGKVESRFADFYLPKVRTPEFVKKAGNEADAMKLVARLQGMQFQITGGKQAFRRLHTHMIRTLFPKDGSRAQIALASQLTRRQVRRLCAGITPDATADSEALLAALMELDAWSFLINTEPLWTQYDDPGRLQE